MNIQTNKTHTCIQTNRQDTGKQRHTRISKQINIEENRQTKHIKLQNSKTKGEQAIKTSINKQVDPM